jgi:hypothetical protein
MGRGGRVEADRPPGSAELVLASGVSFLQPQDAVLEAMLTDGRLSSVRAC